MKFKDIFALKSFWALVIVHAIFYVLFAPVYLLLNIILLLLASFTVPFVYYLFIYAFDRKRLNFTKK